MKNEILNKFISVFDNKKDEQEKAIYFKNELQGVIDTLQNDLKTPVIAQIRTLELLLGGVFGDLTKEQKSILKEVFDSCALTRKIIQDVLTVHKLKNECSCLNFKELDFCRLVEDCCNEISWQLDVKKLKLEFRSSEPNLKVFGDANYIKEALNTLLATAICYCLKGKTLHAKVEKSEDSAVFCVEYEGRKITQADLDKLLVFYDYSQLKYNQIGVNIEINLANSIICAHRGVLNAKTDEKNSTLGFALPLKRDTKEFLLSVG